MLEAPYPMAEQHDMNSEDGEHLLVILLLLLSLKSGLGDTVQITLSGLGNSATSLILVTFKDADLLERLHNLTVDRAGGIDVVGWARATVAGGAVDLAKPADTDGLAEVDVAGDGGGAHVEPVDGLGWELLGWAGLHGINPTWDWELSLSLQESRVCVDELLGLHHTPRISIIPSSEVIPTPSRLLDSSNYARIFAIICMYRLSRPRCSSQSHLRHKVVDRF